MPAQEKIEPYGNEADNAQENFADGCWPDHFQGEDHLADDWPQAEAESVFKAAKPGIGRRGPASPLKWAGGKHLLSPKLVELMPEHIVYVEVFGGAGHVLFRKTPSPVEVLNDINGELMNFWRVLQSQPEYLCNRYRWALYSREEFYRLRDADVASMSSEERAWRFFYLNRCSFGARTPGQDGKAASFGVWANNYKGTLMRNRFLPRLEFAHARLKDVIIERMSWERALEIYDRPQTFFYLDPPYYGYGKYYGPGQFAMADYARLAARLAEIQGKFLLSIGDCAEARETFGGFRLVAEPEVRYSVNKERSFTTRELVYGNY